jgi:hypothetical protein
MNYQLTPKALFLIVFPPAVFGLQSALERSSIFDLVISRAKHSCSAIEISPQSARQIEFPALTHLACPFPAPGSRFGVMVLASAPDSAPKVLPLFLIPAQGQSPSFCSALARLVFPARGLSFFVRFWSVSLLKFSPGLRCRSDLAS